jgi:hypothetical protein
MDKPSVSRGDHGRNDVISVTHESVRQSPGHVRRTDLFRQEALESLSAVEQWDQPLQLARPHRWLIIAALLMTGVVVAWWVVAAAT